MGESEGEGEVQCGIVRYRWSVRERGKDSMWGSEVKCGRDRDAVRRSI